MLLNDKRFWIKLIEEALQNKAEYNFLDFKLTLSEKNERIKEHINAFGNLERGGCLVFGIENFIAIGLEEPWDHIIQKITSLAKNSQEPILTVDAFPVEITNKKLLCIHILSSTSKPVFIKNRTPLGRKACFKRSGSSIVPMSIDEIKIFLISSTENYYDESIVEAGTREELDFEKLANLLPRLQKDKRSSSRNVSILMDYRILTGEKFNPKITVAGWLCFAKRPLNQRQFRNAYIEFQIFRGIMRNLPIKKYIIEGNLPDQIKQSIQLLKNNIWYIPKIQAAKCEEIPAYQDIILREIVTNSLVHRDYKKMSQPVKISMFDNRVEFENPGCLLPGLTVFNLIHKRDWRNPLLAELVKKFGFGEMDGQGIDRLYAATLSIKVPPPIFSDTQNSFMVVLSAPKIFEQLTPEEKRLMIIVLAIMQ